MAPKAKRLKITNPKPLQDPLKFKKFKKQASPASDTKLDNDILSNNVFDVLSDEETEMTELSRTEPDAVAKKEKVPPIVVTVSDFPAFRSELSSFIPNVKVTYQIGRRGECRVLTESVQNYQHLLKYLTEKMHKFYTYDTKSERPFKVVLKGLSNDQSLDEIKDELRVLLGFAPSQVILMKKKRVENTPSRTGISQQFYLIHFNRNEINNMKILEKAQFMFHVRVKWEHYRKHGGNVQNLTQCRKCQGWGHGTKHCNMDSKCMVCGDSSHTKDTCPVKKEDTVNFKCANCGGNHKSNFWQCPIRQKILDARTKNQQQKQKQRPSGNNIPSPQGLITPGNRVGFSQVLPGSQQLAGSSYASILVGNSNLNVGSSQMGVPTINSTNFSASQASESCNLGNMTPDLGNMTPEKLDFLQKSMLNLISAMLNTNSMFDAIQTGLKFANDIVMTLKFGNGFK